MCRLAVLLLEKVSMCARLGWDGSWCLGVEGVDDKSARFLLKCCVGYAIAAPAV